MSESNKIVEEVDVLCLTTGKCGSHTLRKTIKQSGFKTIKVHQKLDFENIYGYDGLIDLINRSSKNKKLYIIDSYRTPIERKMSSFISRLPHHVPDYSERTVEELVDLCNEIVDSKRRDRLFLKQAIDKIMIEYGVEPFDTFDFEKGYVIKEKDNLIFVKILFSDINKWGTILSEIFHKQIVLQSGNLTKNKEWSWLYDEFKSKYKISESDLNTIAEDVNFKTFTPQAQREKYLKYWSEKQV